MTRFVTALFAAGALGAGFSAAPAAGQVLRYGGDPGTRTYLRQQTDRVVQTVNGRQLATVIESAARLRATVTEAGAGAVTVTIAHDSLAVVEDGAVSPDLSALLGVPVVVVMDDRGRVDVVRLPPTLPPAAARLDLGSTYRFFFPRLPDNDAETGTTWADTTSAAAVQSGLELRVTRVNRYHSRGWAAQGERRVVRVDYETTLTIEGSGEQEEAGIVLSGSGAGTGGYSFDPVAGAFVAGGETLEMRMVALVSAQGQDLVVPIVQLRSFSVTDSGAGEGAEAAEPGRR